MPPVLSLRPPRLRWCDPIALLLAGMPARAELRALLIGVSGYPALPERLRLQGPRNDVQRLRQILLQRGLAPARLRVLADGVPGAALPTRANILAALDELARDAQADDVVVVHFAGHGSRQPAADGSGLAPVFLPLDVGPWDGGARSVQNAIGSPELRAALDRIGDRGAFVWAIVDACHSAALVREIGRAHV